MVRLVVGLGNPTSAYGGTRHNVGREFIDVLAKDSKLKFSSSRQAEILRLPIFIAAKLSCFMNESGGPVRSLMQPGGMKPEELLVVVDDFMIPFGTLRLRPSGSSGGHNGLKSIIESLGSDEFPRLRVGVGPVPQSQDPADFVLGKFSKEEQKKLPQIFDLIKTTVDILNTDGIEKAMNEMNKAHL